METPSSVRDMSEFASSDEDGMDWEEVVPSSYGQDGNTGLQDTLEIDVPGQQPIEITLPTAKSKEQAKKTQARARTLEWRAQQVVRLESHKLHTVCLLSSAWIRNKWINDPLLHARLMSMTPMPIQNSFLMIHKKFQPDPVQRGRLFQAAVGRLTKWWHENFEVHPNGHITSKTFNEALREPQADDNIREPLRGPKSLMKHALAWYGSRDTSALLFTALCRALGVPARLVVSLQSVPWRRSVERTDGPDQSASKKDPKGKGKARAVENGGQESSASDTLDTGKTKPAPKSVTKLKGSKRKSIKSRSATPKHFSLTAEEISPTMWTEVFSRADMRWLPVDPIRNIVNQRQKLEPHPQDKANRMVYVVAFEEDGFARDVTFRYAKAFGGVTVKSRPGGKLRTDGWWESVMSMVTRPYRLKRDDIEDEEFVIKQVTEGMPTSMTGFKDHPVYVLERHIRQTEVIHPKREVGKFRGESVYHRSNVLALKSSENWMRVGRRVREGHQPLKMVKARATTVHRRRALEMAQAETGEESLQGLYSEAQTELFIPDPVIDGKIPKNDFGNIDLYVPSMLPRGAVHVPHKGTAKIARELKIDYAEAVTGFEFRKGHGIPILTGVVVAEEHEELLLDAYWESVHDAEEKERLKRTERVIQRWTKLIHGLRIRKRMQEQY
ncbi:Rad4-domain-containing protein, partial [Sistotremastrum suecicum HHB10207 ss-3]